MKNTNTTLEFMNLAPEIMKALGEYNQTINTALAAVQKLESIAITARLAEMFGVQERQTANIIRQDYFIAA